MRGSTGEASEEETRAHLPAGDFASGLAIAGLSIFVIVISFRMPMPGEIYTAPGLFPFLIALSLLAMSVGLVISAVREGGHRALVERIGPRLSAMVRDVELHRTLFLIGIIFAYVLLLRFIRFDLSLLKLSESFYLRFTSFELVTIIILTVTLRFFWRRGIFKAFIISLATSSSLALIFRYLFHVLLPGS
ncbi:MAG: tripartite tricarboxylate transporter TctB family protein [Nitrospinota bacterium]